jgi:ribosomal-protein-alanine N-acetyltransferase
MILVGADHAGALAAIHTAAFDHPWDRAALADMLSASGVFALTDPNRNSFILVRLVADEGEILTLAVIPSARRQGLARRLLDHAVATAASRGAASLFLEVAADNAAAIALYRAAGFDAVGRRAGYYARSAGPPVDALVLKKLLESPA